MLRGRRSLPCFSARDTYCDDRAWYGVYTEYALIEGWNFLRNLTWKTVLGVGWFLPKSVVVRELRARRYLSLVSHRLSFTCFSSRNELFLSKYATRGASVLRWASDATVILL